MSADKLPEGFSLKIGGSLMSSPKDFFLNSAHNLVFPFLVLKLKSDSEKDDNSFEVRVNPKVYDFFKNNLLSDELVIYSPLNGLWGIWSFDMNISMKMLSMLGILSNFQDWILASRNSMKNLLSNEKTQSIRKDKKALKVAEEILTSLNILNEIKSNSLLFGTVKDVIETKEMDPDTIIYRLAMSLYHTKFSSGNPITPLLDEPSELYLRLLQTELPEKYKDAFSIMTNLPPDARIRTMKIFIAFLISSYAYYKTTND